MAHTNTRCSDLVCVLSLLYHESECSKLEVDPAPDATLAAIVDDEIVEFLALSSATYLRRMPLKAIMKALRSRWVAQEGVKGLLGLKTMVSYAQTLATAEELSQLTYLDKLLGNKLADRLQGVQSELWKRCALLPTVIVPHDYTAVPVSEAVSLRFASLWSSSSYFRPDNLDDILLSGVESLLTLLTNDRDRIQQTLQCITCELAPLLVMKTEHDCTALLSCLATSQATIHSTPTNLANSDKTARETIYLMTLLQLSFINGCLATRNTEDAGQRLLVSYSSWLVGRLLDLAAFTAAGEFSNSANIFQESCQEGNWKFIQDLARRAVSDTVTALSALDAETTLLIVVVIAREGRLQYRSASADRKVVHPGFYVRAVQTLLGPEEPLLRLYWQRGGFSDSTQLLPIVYLTAAIRETVRVDLESGTSSSGWRRASGLSNYERTFALLHALRSWWPTDPSEVLALLFEECSQIIAVICTSSQSLGNASTMTIVAASADLLLSAAQLFGLSPREALNAVTLQAPYDWYLPARDGTSPSTSSADEHCRGNSSDGSAAAGSAVQARWKQEPLSMLRSVLYVRYVQRAEEESHQQAQLTSWLQESFKLDARQTLLLVHDLSILLDEYGCFRDPRTVSTVGCALQSLTAVRVANHPFTRACLLTVSGYMQHIASLAVTGTPNLDNAPPSHADADQASLFTWEATAELEEAFLALGRTEGADSAIFKLLHGQGTLREQDGQVPSPLVRMHVLSRLAAQPLPPPPSSASKTISESARCYQRPGADLFNAVFPHAGANSASGCLLRFSAEEGSYSEAAASGKNVRVQPASAVTVNMIILDQLGDTLSNEAPALPWFNFAASTHTLIHAAYSSLKVILRQKSPQQHQDNKGEPDFATDPDILDIVNRRRYLVLPAVLSSVLREHLRELVQSAPDESSSDSPQVRFDGPYWVAKKYASVIVDILLHVELPPRQFADALRSGFNPATVEIFWMKLTQDPCRVIIATSGLLLLLAERLLLQAKTNMPRDTLDGIWYLTLQFWAIASALGEHGAGNVSLSGAVRRTCAALQASARSFAELFADARQADTGRNAASSSPRALSPSLSARAGQRYWIDVTNDREIVRWQVSYPNSAVGDTASAVSGRPAPTCEVISRHERNTKMCQRTCPVGISLESLVSLLMPRCPQAGAQSQPCAKELLALLAEVNQGVAQLEAGEWSDAQVFLARYLVCQRGARDFESWRAEVLEVLLTLKPIYFVPGTGGIELVTSMLHEIIRSVGATDERDPGVRQESAFAVVARHLKTMTGNASFTAQGAHNHLAWMLNVLQSVRPQRVAADLRHGSVPEVNPEVPEVNTASIESELASVAMVIKVAYQLRVTIPRPVRRLILAALVTCLECMLRRAAADRGDALSSVAQKSVHVIMKYLIQSSDSAGAPSIAAQVQNACFEFLPGTAADKIALYVQSLIQASDALRELETRMREKAAAEGLPQTEIAASRVAPENSPRARTCTTSVSTPPVAQGGSTASLKRGKHKESNSSFPRDESVGVSAKRPRPGERTVAPTTPVPVKVEGEPARSKSSTPSGPRPGQETTPQALFPVTERAQRTPSNGTAAAAAHGVPSATRKLEESPARTTLLSSVTSPETPLAVSVAPAPSPMVAVKLEGKPAERSGMDIPVAASTPGDRPRVSASGKPASAVSKKFSDFGM